MVCATAQAMCAIYSSISVPIYVAFSLSLPGSKELSEGRKHGRKEKAGWNFSHGFMCPLPSQTCATLQQRDQISSCWSSTVGVQKFGMLLNAAKPLALGWGLFWAGTVPVVSSQVGMTESSRQFCGRVSHFARVQFKMTALGFRASFCKNCAGRMKILLVPAWVESFPLVLERGIGVVSCS